MIYGKNMGINVNKQKLMGFVLCHPLVHMAILSVSYGTP